MPLKLKKMVENASKFIKRQEAQFELKKGGKTR